MQLYERFKTLEGMSQELNYNVMFSQRVLNVAHNLHDVRKLKDVGTQID